LADPGRKEKKKERNQKDQRKEEGIHFPGLLLEEGGRKSPSNLPR